MMFKKAVFIFIFLPMTLFCVDFEIFTDYKEALKKAKQEDKILLLMISQKECPMCTFMKNHTLENEVVGEFIDMNFIFTEVELGDQDIPSKFKAFGTPTFYFIDPKTGKKIGRQLIGGAKAPAFLEKLKEYKQKRIEK